MRRIKLILFYVSQIITAKIFLISLSLLLLCFGGLFIYQSKIYQRVGQKISQKFTALRKSAHTKLCASLAVGIPQETPKTKAKEGKFRKINLPKCGNVFQITDVAGGAVTPQSRAVKVTVEGFEAENCDRAEITFRLVREGKVVWKKTEVDSSCSLSGKPNGSYVLSLPTPQEASQGGELELCFDLINKEGGRASQNKPSVCPLLAVHPFLCQKLPLLEGW